MGFSSVVWMKMSDWKFYSYKDDFRKGRYIVERLYYFEKGRIF